MAEIQLTQGQVALVDDLDYNWLNQWKWCADKHHSGNFYAVRRSSAEGEKRIGIRMHRQILGLEKGDKREGDHQDHNTLNNQRYNLRICTQQENGYNRKSNRNSTSKYKGVSWHKVNKKWQVQISINGKYKYLGFFEDEKKAAEAYNMAAIKYFGEFANLNFKLELV